MAADLLVIVQTKPAAGIADNTGINGVTQARSEDMQIPEIFYI